MLKNDRTTDGVKVEGMRMGTTSSPHKLPPAQAASPGAEAALCFQLLAHVPAASARELNTIGSLRAVHPTTVNQMKYPH